MSKKIDDGGPAFPMWTDDMPIQGSAGMTLRDWFAGMALQGMIAANYKADEKLIAGTAYIYADAMLAERQK